MRRAALLVAMAAAAISAPAAAPPEFVQAVEFPYYLCPAAGWERELVWLKAIGIRTVEFSIPWNWHQLQPGDFDFTGRTSPRRDLAGFIRLLRKLELRAWVRPLPPVSGWLNGGWPAGAPPGPAAQRAWLERLDALLKTQTVSHGGPIAYIEARGLPGAPSIDAAAPPSPLVVVSAISPSALTDSRAAIAGAPGSRGALLWTEVEDALYPEGWSEDPGVPLRKGAVGLTDDERNAVGPLRREAALLRNWQPLVGRMRTSALPKRPAGKLPDNIRAVELAGSAASALSVTNSGSQPFHDDLRVYMPGGRRTLTIPGVAVPPGESLWLPFAVSLGPGGLCRDCSIFSTAERIVYATAELLSVEFENGILAMEFAAPEAGEVLLQLARRPIGPYLAAGKPTEFEWDDKTLRARLTIPAGSGPANHVRVGIAVEEPDTSAFFNDARRLLIGRSNVVATMYSSAAVAARSRLRLPPGFTASAVRKSPNEIDYHVTVPGDCLHGDWADLALEADALTLGRAHVQLFRPASIRLSQAIQIHFGPQLEVTPTVPTAPIQAKGGGALEILLHNNSPEIQTFHLMAFGAGLDFFPASTDVNVGPLDERAVALRVFVQDEEPGPHDWHIQVTGAANLDIPMRVIALPRDGAVAWSADLDGDGSPEWVIETRKARAIFSTQNGGRLIEFTWKDGNTNFLPERGWLAQPGEVTVKESGASLEFAGKGWTRTVTLTGAALSIEQTTPLPADQPPPQKRANISLTVERPSPSRAIFTLQ